MTQETDGLMCENCPRQDIKMLLESAAGSSDPFVIQGYELAFSILKVKGCKGPENEEGSPFTDCGNENAVRAAQGIVNSVTLLERVRT